MDSKQKPKRKPKKIYKTVIKLSPPKPGPKGTKGTRGLGEPEIEIDTKPLRPKFLKPRLKPQKVGKKPSVRTFKDGGKTFKIAERFDEALIQRMEWVPVTKKTRWKCIRCGWCCSHEWRVNLTWDEYDRLKDKLPISDVVVDPETGMSHPFYMIKDKCVQYDPKSHKCKIYKIRAYSCATYPFSLTPEGKLVRSKFCKGFGSGDVVDKKKMVGYIKKWRKRAGMNI